MTWLGALGACIVAAAGVYYVWDIIHGTTRPHRVSWGVWALVGILGFASARDGGAGPGAYVAGVFVLATVVTFALSLVPRYGKPGHRRTDVVLGAVALAGIALWQAGVLPTGVAALVAVACDAVALWPTLRSTYHAPRTESLAAWSANAAGCTIGLAALEGLSLASAAYPVYLAVATGVTAALIVVRRRALHGGDPEVRARIAA